jgi:hypothetical protein
MPRKLGARFVGLPNACFAFANLALRSFSTTTPVDNNRHYSASRETLVLPRFAASRTPSRDAQRYSVCAVFQLKS